jgi:hypothetical protein
MEERWKEGINNVKDHFNLLPYTRSFSKALERDIDNDEAVHLAVTATDFLVEAY